MTVPLHVTDLDAVVGTPVYDLAPYFTEMGPRGEVREPDWPSEMLSTGTSRRPEFWVAHQVISARSRRLDRSRTGPDADRLLQQRDPRIARLQASTPRGLPGVPPPRQVQGPLNATVLQTKGHDPLRT